MDIIGTGQKPVVMPHYPHMLSEDTEVWTRFLESKFIEIKEVWYDVHVGSAVLLDVDDDVLVRRIAAGLTRKRIDVVAAVGGGIWIIEIKPFANMYAVGQILTYTRLFRREYVSQGQVVSVIICDDYDKDLLDEFDELGIIVIMNN